MTFYGRHRIMALFWPWNYRPFVTTVDVADAKVSKSCDGTSSLRLALFPRKVPSRVDRTGRIHRDPNTGYIDALRPNDWCFLWVDRMDGTSPEPIFLGLLDRISYMVSLSETGERMIYVNISGSGFEKAIQQTTALTNIYLDDTINLPTLFANGPLGQLGFDRSFTLPQALEWIFKIYLTANRDLDQDAIIDMITAEVDSVVGTEETREGNNSALRPFMGQFELPRTNIPMWYFLRLRFQDVNQRVFVNPSMFVNQANTPLTGLVDAFSNTLINSLIYDVRRVSDPGLSDIEGSLLASVEGGYTQERVRSFVNEAQRVNDVVGEMAADVAPHIILRERPLFADELVRLDGPVLDENDFVEMDLGLSDVDLHNVTMIDTPNLHNNSFLRLGSGFAGFNEYRDESIESMRRHGVRFYEDRTMAWPGSVEVPIPSPELVRDWDIRLQRAGLDEINNRTGSAVIPRFINNLRIGGKLGIFHRENGACVDNSAYVYYVDSIDYTYRAHGNFRTTVGLTRGQQTDQLERSERDA